MIKKKIIKKFANLYYRDSINGPNNWMSKEMLFHWYGKNGLFFDRLLDEVGHEETFNDFCDIIQDMVKGKGFTTELLPQVRFNAMYKFSKAMIKHYYISRLYTATWYRLKVIALKIKLKIKKFLRRFSKP